jgi:hypothetical protein
LDPVSPLIFHIFLLLWIILMTTRRGYVGLKVEGLMPSLHCQIHGDGMIRLPLLHISSPNFIPIKSMSVMCSLSFLLRPWWVEQSILEVDTWLELVELSVLVILLGLAVTVAVEGAASQDLELLVSFLKLFFGVHPQRPKLADVILGRRGGHSMLWCFPGTLARSSYSPACQSGGSSNTYLAPSGRVPRDEMGGRVLESRCKIGGEGPDCFSDFLSRVLCVICEDHATFYIYVQVLLLICVPTV